MQEILFTKEECDWIIEYSKKTELIVRDGLNANVERPHETISYSYYNFYLNNETNWVFDRINTFFTKTTGIKIKKSLDCFHIHKYIVGNRFSKHNDVYYENQMYNVGVCLTEDYNGGDFLLYDPKIILDKKIGNTYTFDCRRMHEVTEVLSGERWTLIAFLFLENLEIKKSIL